jgi:hypothetical protein
MDEVAAEGVVTEGFATAVVGGGSSDAGAHLRRKGSSSGAGHAEALASSSSLPPPPPQPNKVIENKAAKMAVLARMEFLQGFVAVRKLRVEHVLRTPRAWSQDAACFGMQPGAYVRTS